MKDSTDFDDFKIFWSKIGWRGVLELAGLFRLRTRTFEAKNCQAVSADAVFCFLNIFVENERTNAE